MKAKLRVLYHESKNSGDYDFITEGPLGEIRVILRKWTASKHSDLVLYSCAVKDGRIEMESYKRLSGIGDMEAIRHAIAVFDELVAAHPNLGNGDADAEK